MAARASRTKRFLRTSVSPWMIFSAWVRSLLSADAADARCRNEWTPQARADLRGIDRQTALGLLESLTAYALTGQGDVERLTDVKPVESRLRMGDYRIRFYDHGEMIQILRVVH